VGGRTPALSASPHQNRQGRRGKMKKQRHESVGERPDACNKEKNEGFTAKKNTERRGGGQKGHKAKVSAIRGP